MNVTPQFRRVAWRATLFPETSDMIRRSTCPICQKPLPLNAATESATFPFCSVRCRQIDFFRWCDGRYAIVENLPGEIAEELADGET